MKTCTLQIIEYIGNLNVNGQKEVVSDSLFIKVRGPFNGAEKVHKPIRL